MKLFHTGSSNTVNEYHVNFGFLPAKYHILIRTAKFLQKFFLCQKIVYVHCLLMTRASSYNGIFMQFGKTKSTQAACQLRGAVCSKIFDV